MINYSTTSIQYYINLFNGGPITVDGIAGSETKNGIVKIQKELGIEADGIWGVITNQKATTQTLVLQLALSALNYPLTIDGIPGPETVNCVKRFQRDRQLNADGIVGPKTSAALSQESIVQKLLIPQYNADDLPNFTPNEFKCPCGCGGDITPSMKILIQELRDRMNLILRDGQDHPLIITSGFRCPDENELEGGITDSLHLVGLAVDLYSGVMNHKKFDAIINAAHSLGLTCGRYNDQGFVHVQQGRNDFEGD